MNGLFFVLSDQFYYNHRRKLEMKMKMQMMMMMMMLMMGADTKDYENPLIRGCPYNTTSRS
jgi:hypothetical protein